ncbi:MAG: hypothetical protein PHI48_05655 [Bacteroidales bacterium]|nr:hypothetical protein [Bacteroidales bacterium]
MAIPSIVMENYTLGVQYFRKSSSPLCIDPRKGIRDAFESP